MQSVTLDEREQLAANERADAGARDAGDVDVLLLYRFENPHVGYTSGRSATQCQANTRIERVPFHGCNYRCEQAAMPATAEIKSPCRISTGTWVVN